MSRGLLQVFGRLRSVWFFAIQVGPPLVRAAGKQLRPSKASKEYLNSLFPSSYIFLAAKGCPSTIARLGRGGRETHATPSTFRIPDDQPPSLKPMWTSPPFQKATHNPTCQPLFEAYVQPLPLFRKPKWNSLLLSGNPRGTPSEAHVEPLPLSEDPRGTPAPPPPSSPCRAGWVKLDVHSVLVFPRSRQHAPRALSPLAPSLCALTPTHHYLSLSLSLSLLSLRLSLFLLHSFPLSPPLERSPG